MSITDKKIKKWKVKWDSGGCGVDVWGYVNAYTKEEAEDLMEKDYFTGEPYNDDNLFVIEIEDKNEF